MKTPTDESVTPVSGSPATVILLAAAGVFALPFPGLVLDFIVALTVLDAWGTAREYGRYPLLRLRP